MTRTLGLMVCTTLLLVGCRKGDQVPTYVDIPSVALNASDAEGGNTSKITDVWVSVNDRSVGVWELPARVPVLGTGNARITVTPAVKRNGAFDDRLRYPYYTAFNASVELVPEATVNLAPMVAYTEGAGFWYERFNDAGNLLTVSDASDTTMLVYTAADHPTVLRDGTSCGGFVLETARPNFTAFTTEDFAAANGPAYIELDYSTDVNLTIGLTYVQNGNTQYEPWVILVPTTDEGGIRWNKVYIDVSTLFNVSGISQRDIYLGSSLPSSQGTAHVYLDNLKLIRSAP